jgi:hypothetical protein
MCCSATPGAPAAALSRLCDLQAGYKGLAAGTGAGAGTGCGTACSTACCIRGCAGPPGGQQPGHTSVSQPNNHATKPPTQPATQLGHQPSQPVTPVANPASQPASRTRSRVRGKYTNVLYFYLHSGRAQNRLPALHHSGTSRNARTERVDALHMLPLAPYLRHLGQAAALQGGLTRMGGKRGGGEKSSGTGK